MKKVKIDSFFFSEDDFLPKTAAHGSRKHVWGKIKKKNTNYRKEITSVNEQFEENG